MGKAGNIIASGILVLVVLVLIGVMVAPRLIGFQLEPIISGSMEPTIHTGALIAIVKTDPAQVKAGDIIGFHVAGIDTPVCHRVIELTQTDTGYGFVTKGDANSDPDPWVVAPQDVIGRVPFNVSWFGFLAKFIKTPTGFIVLMGIPAAAIVFLEIRNLVAPAQTRRKRPRLRSHPARWPLFLPLIVGLILLVTGWGMMIGNHTEKTFSSMNATLLNDDSLKYTTERTMQNKGKLPLVICLKSVDPQVVFSEDYFSLAPGQQKQVEITGYDQDALITTSGFFPILPQPAVYALFKWNTLIAPVVSLAIWIIPIVLFSSIVIKVVTYRPQLNRRARYFRGALANE